MPVSALDSWWNKLDDNQKADAVRGHKAGKLSDAVEKTLRDAGVVKGPRQGKGIPGDVDIFLKARH